MRFEHNRHRVDHEMKQALVDLIKLFECGLVPETDAEVELMLKCITDRANERLNPVRVDRRYHNSKDQLRWDF